MTLPLERSGNPTARSNFDALAGRLGPLLENVRWGNGSPEGAVAATVGTVYLRKDGGTGTTAYSKETGTGNTGWNPLASGGGAYSDEAAQDAIGAALVDTASVNFTYNDAANQITADVLPAGVDHGGLGGLADDDHSQYPLLLGRAGGQNLAGGTAATDTLTLRPNTNASPTGRIIMPLVGSTLQLNVNTTLMSAIEVNTGETVSLVSVGSFKALTVNGTIDVTAQPGNISLLTFVFDPAINYTAAGAWMRGTRIFGSSPNITLANAVAHGALQSGTQEYMTFASTTDLAAATGGATATVARMAGLRLADSVGTGWTVTDYRGFGLTSPTGSGTITNLIGVDLEDYGSRATNPMSLRSLGALVQMRHAGPAVFGATGAPNTALGIDVAGDFSTRLFGLALVNGANDDIAVGNHSFIRITGPTGAFNITSLGTPYNGKIVTLVNTTAFAMTITNAAGTGTAANRIVTSTNADLVGTAGNQTSVTLIYDSTTARWRDMAFRA